MAQAVRGMNLNVNKCYTVRHPILILNVNLKINSLICRLGGLSFLLANFWFTLG